jgi:glucosylceramidase
MRVGSDEPAGGAVKDVAFRNPNGGMVLYTLNAGTTSQEIGIRFRGRTLTTILPAGSITTFVWKP